MPVSALKPCCHNGCKALVRGRARCAVHQKEFDAAHDARRGSSASRGYGGRWQKARATFLRSNPLCVMCQSEGRVVAATVVDHKVPHRGDQVLFWNTGNWQSLCAHHHNSTKQAQERSV